MPKDRRFRIVNDQDEVIFKSWGHQTAFESKGNIGYNVHDNTIVFTLAARLQVECNKKHYDSLDAEEATQLRINMENDATSSNDVATMQFVETYEVVNKIERVYMVSPEADIWDLRSQATPSPRMVMDYISKFVGLGKLYITATVKQCGATSLRNTRQIYVLEECRMFHEDWCDMVMPGTNVGPIIAYDMAWILGDVWIMGLANDGSNGWYWYPICSLSPQTAVHHLEIDGFPNP